MFLYGLDQGGGVLGPYDLPQQISTKLIFGKQEVSFEMSNAMISYPSCLPKLKESPNTPSTIVTSVFFCYRELIC